MLKKLSGTIYLGDYTKMFAFHGADEANAPPRAGWYTAQCASVSSGPLRAAPLKARRTNDDCLSVSGTETWLDGLYDIREAAVPGWNRQTGKVALTMAYHKQV